MSYLITLHCIHRGATIHLCRTSVTKRRRQRHGIGSNPGYHRLGNLGSNYNRVPKYPSPSYGVFVSCTCKPACFTNEARSDYKGRPPRRIGGRLIRVRVPPKVAQLRPRRETRFLHQIFTHFYWVLNPFGIIRGTLFAILSRGSVTRSLRDLPVSRRHYLSYGDFLRSGL